MVENPTYEKLQEMLEQLSERVQRLEITEKELLKHKALLGAVAESLPFGIFAINKEGVYILQNSVTLDSWGDIIGKRPDELDVSPEALEIWEKNNRRAFSGETVREEVSYSLKGKTHHFFNIITPLAQDGEVFGILIANMDITDRKEAEKKAAESQERLRLLVQHAPTGIYELDQVNQRFLQVNQLMCDYTGYSREEFMAMSPQKLLTERSLKLSQERIEAISRGETVPDSVEFEIKRKDGSVFWALLSFRFVYEDGIPVRSFAVAHDISERKEMERRAAESEERLRLAVQHAPAGIYEVDFQTRRFIRVNDLMCQYTGYTREEFLSMDAGELLTKESLQLFLDRVATLAGGKEVPESVEFEIRKKDGSTFWALLQTRHLLDEEGRPTGAFVVASDITERRLAEEKVGRARKEWEDIFQAVGHPALILDPTHRILSANRAAVEVSGKTEKELLGRLCHEIFHGSSNAPETCPMERALSTGRMQSLEVEMAALGGVYHVSCTPVFNEKGHLEKIIHIATDIQDRIQAEQALRQSENRFRAITESARDWIFCKDESFHYTYVNPAMARDLGKRPEELLSLSAGEVFEPESARAIARMDGPVLAGRTADAELTVFVHGAPRTVHVIKVPMVDEAGQFMGLSGIVRDITDRKRMEAELMEENAFRKAIIRRFAEGMSVCHDIDQRPFVHFTLWNDRMTEITGYTLEEINRLGWYQAMYPDPDYQQKARERMKQMHHGQDLVAEEWEITRKDGQNRTLLVSTSLLESKEGTAHVLALIQDVTEKKRMEQEIMRAEKLDSIGVLAGGVAHDFNNLLMGMQGNLSMLMLEKDRDDPELERLRAIEQCISDATGLTRQLLGFARGGKYEPTTTNVNWLIEKTTAMFGRTRKEIRIHTDLADVWPVEADRGQLEQVLMNLFVNAWQAMPEGGDLKVSTKNLRVGEQFTGTGKIGPGRYVQLEVADTGQGMDAQCAKRAFDPFFTTKEKSRGTGLGLSSADGIIKNHGGLITVDSAVGKGSTFTILLPASENKAVLYETVHPGLSYGKETILLVDDEKVVLQTGADMLRALGYNVLIADSGKDGVRVFKENRDSVDLVLLDLIMPDLGGNEVFLRMRAQRQDAKVLLCSGYSARDQASLILELGCEGFIQKPFTLEDLSRKLREVLDQPKGR